MGVFTFLLRLICNRFNKIAIKPKKTTKIFCNSVTNLQHYGSSSKKAKPESKFFLEKIHYGGYCFMNTDLILMFGALILLAISGLLVFCFTESKGKNTPYARRSDNNLELDVESSTSNPQASQAARKQAENAIQIARVAQNVKGSASVRDTQNTSSNSLRMNMSKEMV